MGACANSVWSEVVQALYLGLKSDTGILKKDMTDFTDSNLPAIERGFMLQVV